MIDLHNHTTRCRHAVGTMEAYVKEAIRRGITHFGFADHSPWTLNSIGERYAMLEDELPGYVAEVGRLKENYNRMGSATGREFHIFLGMEMDYIPSRLNRARKAIDAYDWDYLIGSVHNIGFEKLQRAGMYDSWDIDDIYELYFQQVHTMIQDRFGDIVGHIDLPKKMGRRPLRGMLFYIEPIIPDLRASKMAVEINTSGLDNPSMEFMPGWDVVKRLWEEGIPLTLGGDAHAPDQVGRHIEQAIAGLKKIGVNEIVRFEKRRPIVMPL